MGDMEFVAYISPIDLYHLRQAAHQWVSHCPNHPAVTAVLNALRTAQDAEREAYTRHLASKWKEPPSAT